MSGKRVRSVLFCLLILGVWMSIDLGYNFFYSMIPGVNDGITICGFWAQLLLPDYGWSRVRYLELFRNAVVFTAITGIALLMTNLCAPIRKFMER